MSSVVYLKALADSSAFPCLVLIDMQQEYVSQTRFMAVPGAQSALANCRSALAFARSSGFPVAFLRRVSQSPFFNRYTAFSTWIEGFEPTATDMIFERTKPSCYSSELFAEVVDNCGGHIVLAGFAGETACLATAIDAFHRNHRFAYLADASASHGLDDIPAGDVQRAVNKIIGIYGEVLDTDAWIARTTTNPVHWQEGAHGYR
jgi:nicotinamidase-related amidase